MRLSSIEATEVTRELIDVMAEHPDKICPHVHLCLQSGADSVLRRMRRRWGVRMFLDRCRRLRESLDRPAITTDVIVGFPRETDEEFAQTCRTVREAGFSKIHIFPFSARQGTPAADMSGQLPKQLKAERSRRLQAIELELREAYFQSLLGSRLRVLAEVESDQAGRLRGTSCRYAPVELAGHASQRGQLIDVAPHSVTDAGLVS